MWFIRINSAERVAVMLASADLERYATLRSERTIMLTIYIPLPEGHRYPNDEDAWFLESLSVTLL